MKGVHDKLNIMEFASAIALPKAAMQCILKYELTTSKQQHLHYLFYHHREAFFSYLEGRADAP